MIENKKLLLDICNITILVGDDLLADPNIGRLFLVG